MNKMTLTISMKQALVGINKKIYILDLFFKVERQLRKLVKCASVQNVFEMLDHSHV